MTLSASNKYKNWKKKKLLFTHLSVVISWEKKANNASLERLHINPLLIKVSNWGGFLEKGAHKVWRMFYLSKSKKKAYRKFKSKFTRWRGNFFFHVEATNISSQQREECKKIIKQNCRLRNWIFVTKKKESRICLYQWIQEVSELFSEMKEIVRTNERMLWGRKKLSGPWTWCGTYKVDRFRNLVGTFPCCMWGCNDLARGSWAKNDKTLEFLRNLGNLSAEAPIPESRELSFFSIRENVNETIIFNQKILVLNAAKKYNFPHGILVFCHIFQKKVALKELQLFLNQNSTTDKKLHISPSFIQLWKFDKLTKFKLFDNLIKIKIDFILKKKILEKNLFLNIQ